MGGARDAGLGRVPVDASGPDAAGFKLLLASEGREAQVGDKVRLVPGGNQDEELDYDEAIVIGRFELKLYFKWYS